jgi:catechol 2,3-dioxygenase-like lactoylglutathione lyase family enzyme
MLKGSKAFSSFSVGDAEAAKAFYRDVLGLTVTDRDMYFELQAGDNAVMVYDKPDHTPATFTVLNFPVDDAEAAVDELTSRGVVFESYDNEWMKTDAKGIADSGEGPIMAWFKDPAGNVMSVVQERK